MEKVTSANGQPGYSVSGKSLFNQSSEILPLGKCTVQKALCKWYNLLKNGVKSKEFSSLFEGIEREAMLKSLQTDLEMMPGLLMDEMINDNDISDKKQYIRIVQALLINLSDIMLESINQEQLCDEAETVLQFIQNFLYQYFDFDYRVSAYWMKQLQDCINLKLDYWKIKLNQSPLIDTLKECVNEKFVTPENYLTYRKMDYLRRLFRLIESSVTAISEEFIRELFVYYNFNSSCFIDYEIGQIKSKLKNENNYDENISILLNEQFLAAKMKVKPGVAYEPNHPPVKKQIIDWVCEKIRNEEFCRLKKNDKDLHLEPGSKIQTSLSVAKLAVLIRLMVADKIIVNKSVAPMLRTVAKLFTTLQKDEISFGSLETKYHAPDKATLSIMKEVMQKWAVLTAKL